MSIPTNPRRSAVQQPYGCFLPECAGSEFLRQLAPLVFVSRRGFFGSVSHVER